MSDEPEVVIRLQMEETRSALTEKLETLEHQVVETVAEANTAVAETVENVREAVQETVDAVKDTVHDTVHSVRETFDLTRQMDHHPWVFMGSSLALGYLGGFMFHRATADVERRRSSMEGLVFRGPPEGREARSTEIPAHRDGAEERSFQAPRRPEEPGLFTSLSAEFASEIGKVKSLAIGMGLGLVRDLVRDSVPEPIRPRFREIMDSVVTKLGGEVIQGPVLGHSTESPEEHTRFHAHHEHREMTGAPGIAH